MQFGKPISHYKLLVVCKWVVVVKSVEKCGGEGVVYENRERIKCMISANGCLMVHADLVSGRAWLVV